MHKAAQPNVAHVAQRSHCRLESGTDDEAQHLGQGHHGNGMCPLADARGSGQIGPAQSYIRGADSNEEPGAQHPVLDVVRTQLQGGIQSAGESEERQGNEQGESDGAQSIAPPAEDRAEDHLAQGIGGHNQTHELLARIGI